MWYVARRVAYLIPVWLGITLLAFVVGQFAPGRPGAHAVRAPAPAAAVAGRARSALRHELGLDRPVVERYVRSVADAVRGDLGTSFTSGRPVARELLDRLPATLELAGAATLLAVAAGPAARACSRR